ncbi:uncharacterized protein BX664DRAFT_176876 [Halteromyces radiatus]|uniref:uncharacterized protein n=1 Tax=Halteromyces radiatus TaxID=101107 RepID=UPI0022202509|nr:uncharacterized protein BX664DRAFT_176876 [Halteromyces radiatus]KAI8085002.1 hypothetical protein BX664DRAFT_176876 [Halteromyces radiatus]
MRVSFFFLLLLFCIITLGTASLSLPNHFTTMKSTTKPKSILVKPISTISYFYYMSQSLYRQQDIFINKQDTSRIIKKETNNNTSSNSLDGNRHNGPVTAFILVLFFCILTF